MRKSTKSALMSAFIFPGAGHLYLKRYSTAAVLAAGALIALYVVVSSVVEKALHIADKILSGEVPADISAIIDLVSKPLVGEDALLVECATTGLIIAWLVGIVHSYIVARLQENREKSVGAVD